MTYLLGLFLLVAGGLVLATILVQAAHRSVDLLCVRNVFLVGLVVFQFVSAGLSLVFNVYDVVYVAEPARTGFIFTFWALTFLAVFAVTYGRGWGVRIWAHHSPAPLDRINPFGAMALAVIVTILGLLIRVGIGRNIPLVGILADIVGMGVLSAA